MSADSRLMPNHLFDVTMRRIDHRTFGRYLNEEIDTDQYDAECSHNTECIILHAVHRAKMRQQGYLPQLPRWAD